MLLLLFNTRELVVTGVADLSPGGAVIESSSGGLLSAGALETDDGVF